MTIRVVLADDQPLIRAGIGMLIRAEPDMVVVGEADDGAQAVSLALRESPDVVVMDVRMPGTDGVEATRQIVAGSATPGSRSTAAILILTMYNVDEAVYAALRAGASGFLLKDAAPDELPSAIRALADGNAWLDPAVARLLLNDFAARPERSVPTPTEMQQLTPREREVLALVAHGLSNVEIAGYLGVGENTVKTHFGRVLMKLALRDRAQAVVAAYRTGLVSPTDVLPPSPHA
jgi:DNA-binding NarL/FixJ family response regulator